MTTCKSWPWWWEMPRNYQKLGSRIKLQKPVVLFSICLTLFSLFRYSGSMSEFGIQFSRTVYLFLRVERYDSMKTCVPGDIPLFIHIFKMYAFNFLFGILWSFTVLLCWFTQSDFYFSSKNRLHAGDLEIKPVLYSRKIKGSIPFVSWIETKQVAS